MFLTNIEIPLALALNARGARVEMVYDDATLPICELISMETVDSQRQICDGCVAHVRRMLDGLPIRIRFLSELCPPSVVQQFHDEIADLTFAEILQYEIEGNNLGRAAWRGMLRYLKSGAIDETAENLRVLKRYLVSAMISRHAAAEACAEGPIHAALMSHGIYTPWEPSLRAFQDRDVPVAVYDRATGIDRFQFNWNVSPNSGDMAAAWDRTWRVRQLDPTSRRQALEYIADREQFRNEGVKFSTAAPAAPEALRQALDLPSDKTVLLLTSNLVWDAAAAGRDVIFTDTVDWVATTIRAVAANPALFLVVKPHPAERLRGTRMFVGTEIRKLFPTLPGNVRLLEPDSPINPMSLMKVADVGIVHTSTAGLEMAVLAKPVITVSSAHYREKGFTFDPASRDAYLELISSAAALPRAYTPEMHEEAIKYTYVRYFKYQIDLPLLIEKDFLNVTGWRFDSLDGLLPGRCPGLDFVCDAILARREDFVQD